MNASSPIQSLETPETSALLEAAKFARDAGLRAYDFRRAQRRALSIVVPLLVVLGVGLVFAALHDTWKNPFGEPFSWTAGVSAWPTEILRYLAFALAVLFVGKSYAAMHSGILDLVRRYRLPLNGEGDHCEPRWRLSAAPVPKVVVPARSPWILYQQLSEPMQRVRRTMLPFILYFGFCVGLSFLLGQGTHSPVRGTLATHLDRWVLWMSILAFLFLTFWIMDGARLCRWLIEQLSEAHTHYPDACLNHFAEQRSLQTKPELLAEWLDLQLIAELTQQVGKLVYYPFIVFFLMLIARNGFWDRWGWPPLLVIIFCLNLSLAASSMIILQRSAHKAREVGLARLQAKVEQKQKESAVSTEKHEADMGEKLLKEIRSLKKGAFVPFWQNPVVGAILVPSGGTAFLEILIYLLR